MEEIDVFEGFLMAGMMITALVLGTDYYKYTKKAEQDRKNGIEWAEQRASIQNDRLERLYRVQSESILTGIPMSVAIEYKDSDRMEKLFRYREQRAFEEMRLSD